MLLASKRLWGTEYFGPERLLIFVNQEFREAGNSQAFGISASWTILIFARNSGGQTERRRTTTRTQRMIQPMSEMSEPF